MSDDLCNNDKIPKRSLYRRLTIPRRITEIFQNLQINNNEKGNNLIEVNDKLKFQVDHVGSIPQMTLNVSLKIQFANIIRSHLYLGFEKDKTIYVTSIQKNYQKEDKLIIRKLWNLSDNGSAQYPLQIKSDFNENFYVSGLFIDCNKYGLSKYDKNYNFIMKTNLFENNIFTDFDFDANDNIVLISKFKSYYIYNIMKFSNDFDKFFYKFNFSNNDDKQIYSPINILLNGINGKSWIIANKNIDGNFESRLIEFNSNVKIESNKEFNFNSWNSKEIDSTALVKFNDAFMLTVSHLDNSLYCLWWDEIKQKLESKKVTKSYNPLFKYLCSDAYGTAYIFTDSYIYRFRDINILK